MFQARRKS